MGGQELVGTGASGPTGAAPEMVGPKVFDRATEAVFHLKNKKVLVVFFALVALLGLIALVLPGGTKAAPLQPPSRPVTTAQAKAVAREVGRDLLVGAPVGPSLVSASLGRQLGRPAASPPIPEVLSHLTTTLVAHRQGEWLYRVTATLGRTRAAVQMLVEAAPRPVVVVIVGLNS